MPSINEMDRGYRAEPGTTICVNVNPIQMGGLYSIREILDKYVQFPEVRVIYNGQEGYKEYPTQQELMEAVYALNPDGVVKEYVHEIPDEVWDQIKREYPPYSQKAKPSVVFRYVPTNWETDTEKMVGVMVQVKRDPLGRDLSLRRELKTGTIKLTLTAYNDRYQYYEHAFSMAIHGANSILCPDEQKLWDMYWTREQFAKDKVCGISHNGVWITNVGWHKMIDNYLFGMVLLREDFLPQLNMARDKIMTMPVELECCFTKIPGLQRRQGQEKNNETIVLATEMELWEILKKHPRWRKILEQENCCNENGKRNFEEITFDRDLQVALWLACWKRKCRVILSMEQQYFGREIWSVPAYSVEEAKESDDQTAAFPVKMFTHYAEESLLLRPKYLVSGNYNRNHSFSQWLIHNRASLAEKVPTAYNKILRAMMLEHDRVKIRNTLNSIIVTLRNYPENPFRVPVDLVLTEKDL